MSAVMLLAFERNEHGDAIPAFNPLQMESVEQALAEAEKLSPQDAGVVVWRRNAQPAVGELSEPIIIYQRGIIGDFG
jgi:hypothetical protein